MRNLPNGGLASAADEPHANVSVVAELERLERFATAQQRDATARDDALLNGRAGRVERVLDAGLLFLHLDLGRRADSNHGDASCEFREALLELLAIVVARRVRDLLANGFDAAFDLSLLASTIDDDGVVLVDLDALRSTQILEGRAIELLPKVLHERSRAGKNRDVLEHLLAAITEARCLDGSDFDRAAKLIHDERRERFAVDVLGEDEQLAAALHDLLEQGEQVRHGGDLLLVNEDERVIQHDRHLLAVGHEVRREIATIELHALHRLELGVHALVFFDGDDAFLADLLHGVGEDVADLRVAVGADGGNLRDLRLVLRRLRARFDGSQNGLDRRVDASLQVRGAVPRLDEA